MVYFKENYNFPRFQRGFNIFSRGGIQLFLGESNCLFPIESHISCVSPGGSGPLAPPPPLDQRMQYLDQLDAVTKVRYVKKLSILTPIPPPPPLGIPKCNHGVWENNHYGLTRIQIVFPGSDNFGSNPLYFTLNCIKTLPDMSSADIVVFY